MTLKDKLINTLITYGALRFGDFTLKSGRHSPFFMDAGRLSSGDSLALLGRCYGKVLFERFREATVVFGPAYKGIPLAVATAVASNDLYGTNVRFCANRKEVKDHGADTGSLLGSLSNTDKIVIIEDVTTSGASIDECMPKILAVAPEAKVLGEIILLDRKEKASPDDNKPATKAIEDKWGFPVEHLLTMDEIVDSLYTRGDKRVITPAVKASLDEYYKTWGF